MDVQAVNEALDALTGLGAAWRGDWSFFDGRSLRDQIASWRELMDSALAGEANPDDAKNWLLDHDVCPVCRSWSEWCDNRDEHFGAAA